MKEEKMKKERKENSWKKIYYSIYRVTGGMGIERDWNHTIIEEDRFK
jgi:hypothetical protein